MRAALQRLAHADAQRAMAGWRSLAPGVTNARSLLEIGHDVLEDDADPGTADLFAQGLVTIATAMRRAFPRNIFGDLDLLAASLWRGARMAAGGPEVFLRDQCARVATLQALFGEGTAIRFSYVHDFIYGFDWAKWVARAPQVRAAVGPFDPAFLIFLEQRGLELLERIDRGIDQKYPPLVDQRPRNPFGFSREPDAEFVLHRHLAKERLLPIEAWRINAPPIWSRPFAELRRQRAEALGLGTDPYAASRPSKRD